MKKPIVYIHTFWFVLKLNKQCECTYFSFQKPLTLSKETWKGRYHTRISSYQNHMNQSKGPPNIMYISPLSLLNKCFCLHTPNEHLITTTTSYSWPLSPIPIYIYFFSIPTNFSLHSPLLKYLLFIFLSLLKHQANPMC